MGTIQADPSDTPTPDQHQRLVKLLLNAEQASYNRTLPGGVFRAELTADLIERSAWLASERDGTAS